MPRSDRKAIPRSPALFWTRYRQWAREYTPLWLWTIVFLGLLLVIDRSDIANAVYMALVLFPAIAVAGAGDLRALFGSWTVRAAFAFLAFMVLTPLWTGGIGDANWPEAALASAAVATFVLITAHLAAVEADYPDTLLKALAVVALATALYSAIMEYQSHWFSYHLVIVPWENPNTGAAVVGLLLTGMAAGPGMNAKEWPGMRMLYWAVVVLLALLLFMTQTRAAMMGVAAAALACVLARPPKLRHLAAWGAGAAIFIGLVLFFFRDLLLRGDSGRSDLIVDFWHLVEDRFLLGLGVQAQGRILVWLSTAYLEAPHNMLMTALVYGGAIAVALLAAFYVAMIAAGIGSGRRGLSLAPLGMAVYVAVHGLFETVYVTTPGWQWLYLWLPVGLIAGAELRGRAAKVA